MVTVPGWTPVHPRLVAAYPVESIGLWELVANLELTMSMQFEGERLAALEQRVDQLQNTLKAVARESDSVTVHGPCPACEQCLLLLKGSTMYCPHCGDGQNL